MTVIPDVLSALGGPRPAGYATDRDLHIVEAETSADLAAYHRLRHDAFVADQGLFSASDHDDVDDHPSTIVLLARHVDGTVLGGVRLAPGGRDELAWWHGGRLVVSPQSRRFGLSVSAALVKAACARAELEGALRFDATVQIDKESFFARLGWHTVRPVEAHGRPHVLMRWPIGRIAALAETKASIGSLFGQHQPGGPGWVGDDGVPIPDSDLVAVTDAIVPAMIERDPRWAGWCSVLVNANDLSAMGATPVGMLDALAVPTVSLGRRVVDGIMAASEAYGVPVLGGHTQVGVPGALSVTMFGRTDSPIAGGRGRPGDDLTVVADLAGGWRPGYTGRQWDSTTTRSSDELRRMQAGLASVRPRAAKDISMTGLVGTVAMLAEASGCGAHLRLADIPRPESGQLADWLTCFPGFGMIVADQPGRTDHLRGALTPATTATCGHLTTGAGVVLEWPDGETLRVVTGPVTGLGRS